MVEGREGVAEVSQDALQIGQRGSQEVDGAKGGAGLARAREIEDLDNACNIIINDDVDEDTQQKQQNRRNRDNY